MVQINIDATAVFIQQLHGEGEAGFDAARRIVRHLGAHLREGRAEIGFWVPDGGEVVLEVLRPQESLDLRADRQQVTFIRQQVPLVRDGEFVWGVIDGMIPGSRDRIGDFYWLRRPDGRTITDFMAYSVPFGVLAPAEFYDMDGLFAGRGDAEHFQNLVTEADPDGVPRITAPVNILQIHPGTASADGTLAGLTEIYTRIADKIRAGEALTPAEENYVGYDAIELMPVEPPIEHEAGPLFWEEIAADDESVTVTLRRHDIIDWGYDVMISASPATNPSVLRSKRPDELLDLIVALHNFPGRPIMFMYDIVYGHTDNQALKVFPPDFLAGPNMYGQNLNYLNPVVRAMLIEMQRRKHDYGADGIRVDGAQDFKWWQPDTDEMIHDDDYLRLMNDVEQEAAGVRYRPWMIFEDGRPWPRTDWELASTYREVTRHMSNVWQWGPLTFAHNTPFLFTFWINKWWRIREMAEFGREWITGCANHDTLRRGTQVPLDARVNTYLGDTLPEIFQNGYDNPAAKLFDYAMMPGVPMDFLQGAMRAPWGFIRNTDDRYGVKVVSEEARFSNWAMTEERFTRDVAFPRLKAMGFSDLGELRRFMHTLDHAVQATDGALPVVADMMNAVTPPLAGPRLDVAALKRFAHNWMEDVHEYCNVTLYYDDQIPERTAFNRVVRVFRRQRPWLMDNIGPNEYFNHLHPTRGAVIFYGLRRGPDEDVLFVANMEGAPRTLTPLELPVPDLPRDGWQLALAAPGLTITAVDAPFTLADSQGAVFVRTN